MGVQSILGDAKAALIGLGYREHEVTGLLNRIIAEMETPPGKAEDLVRSALRQLV
jgi:Holliday junction resolvasome RuvABC DNA-binding subunit